VDIRLNAFPSRDREFVDYVQAAWATLTAPKSPDALQQSLRVRYPAAIVTIQEELARHGDGPIVWYAFRTAAIGAPAIDDSPEDDAAWAILDDERRFLEVSPGLARIAELPARGMIGHAIEDFSNPADPTIREDIARLWAEFRSGGTLASTLRFNFADGRPREVAYRLVADADGPGRHRLWVRVLAPSEGMPSR
jgi:PAS domain-containing protein